MNYRNKPVGGAPRFGSAHFRLTARTLERTTFCYPDSILEPADFGVATRMRLVELALAGSLDALDDYIEAQVHGPVRLAHDVEALVLDPCYRGTPVETAAQRLDCPVEWHPGFRLGVDELRRHPDYRGREYVELGAQIASQAPAAATETQATAQAPGATRTQAARRTRAATDTVLNPRIIGDTARTGQYDPQAVKKVWHCLARFGAPPGRAGSRASDQCGPAAR